jgi:hypothetical protein
MANESDQARSIAERVAQRVSGHSSTRLNELDKETSLSSELAAMRTSLAELQRRLGKIEMRVRSGISEGNVFEQAEPAPVVLRTQSPWLAVLNANMAHPSQEKFGVEEATVNELVDFFQNEKKCSMEPGGKPCDHCAMCNSRGF